MDSNICDGIKSDGFYRYFLHENDNDNSVACLTISEQIKKLSEGIDILSRELQSQVREQHSALLSQASHAGNLDIALESVSGHMERILTTAHRLRNSVNTQYNLMENQSNIVERLHQVSHLLRSCGNVLQLTKKLRSTKDILKQAHLYYELEPYLENPQLKNINFIQDERSYVIVNRQKLQNFALEELVSGLKENKESQVTTSLNIFVNFHTIAKCLQNLIDTFITDLTQTLKECFAGTDVSTLSASVKSTSIVIDSQKERRGPGKTPTLTTSQHFRTKLLKSLNWLISEELYDYCQQIILLNKCLENMNQFNFTNNCSDENISKKFWTNVEELLKTSFTDCPGHISQTLQEGLPKILSSARTLENKLSYTFILSDEIFQSLEAGYLVKCATNLKASNAAIELPNKESVEKLVRAASTEFCAALVDNRLGIMITDVFNACNKDFWTKIESQIKLGTDSKQVVDIPNAIQLQNINLANVIFYHSEATKKMINDLGENFKNSSAAESILKSLDYAATLNASILKQIFDSIKVTVGIILLSIHREPGLNNEKLSAIGPSFYMKEMQDFLQRAWSYHVSPFDDKKTIEKFGEELASSSIQLFVNNVVILRPISIAGRNRIKNDCVHLETALKPVIANLSNLKKPYRLLRSIAALIVQSPTELIKQEIETESPISSHMILFLLFGYAGADVLSPHASANWSNERLIQWLDGHTSEKERLELIAGALQKYRDSVRKKNSTQYDAVYPLLSSFFERAYKAVH